MLVCYEDDKQQNSIKSCKKRNTGFSRLLSPNHRAHTKVNYETND